MSRSAFWSESPGTRPTWRARPSRHCRTRSRRRSRSKRGNRPSTSQANRAPIGSGSCTSGSDADQGSRIVRIKDDPASTECEVIFDVPDRLVYSVCFHADYRENGFVYLFSNGPRNAENRMNQVTRFTVGRNPQGHIELKSAMVVIEWKSAGHDGGDMTFGLDGMFYITTGDGTSDSDGWDSGQTLNDLLGSVLRIDVNRRDGPRPYSIPTDNPFVNTPGARPEIWAYGLRNPWRMCPDPKTGTDLGRKQWPGSLGDGRT